MNIIRLNYKAMFWFINIVFLVFVNDSFAYLVGKMIGKTPLTKLSPRKSLEGFFGGFFGTVILALIFYN